MKINRVDHIGIAVPNLQEAKKFYEEVLGIKITKEDEVIEDQKVKVSFVPCGEVELELLESTTEDGPIAKYLAKNGGRSGIQHVALNVDNIEEAIAEMKEKGVRMIDEQPRYGAGNSSIAFVHPKASGILVELAQRLDVSQTHMSNLEHGRVSVSLRVLLRLAHFFKCSVDTLLGSVLQGHVVPEVNNDGYDIEDLALLLKVLKQKRVEVM